MKTKLTLRVEDDLIQRAKVWAKERDMTLSEAVAQFFTGMRVSDVEAHLDPWTRSLVGIARRPGRPAPTDEEVRQIVYDYLDEKYR